MKRPDFTENWHHLFATAAQDQVRPFATAIGQDGLGVQTVARQGALSPGLRRGRHAGRDVTGDQPPDGFSAIAIQEDPQVEKIF